MGTRLWTEALIKRHHPHLRYVRVHTAGRNAAVIYAWDENLELSDTDRTRLKRFAAGYLPFYLCCQVKAYSMLQEDRVPPVPEPPEPIFQAAMNRSLNQRAILELLKEMLSGGEIAFDRYDETTGTLHFQVRANSPITAVEKELIRHYLYEVLPIGTFYEVAYR